MTTTVWLVVDVRREVDGVVLDHEVHEDPEQLPVADEKRRIDLGVAAQVIRRAPGGVEKALHLFVELVDVPQQDLGVDLLLALEVEVDRPLAQLGAPGDAVHRDGPEPLLEEFLSRRAEDRVAPLLLLPLSPAFRPQDLPPGRPSRPTAGNEHE